MGTVVVEVPGADGLVRVVDVRMQGRVFRRPLTKTERVARRSSRDS